MDERLHRRHDAIVRLTAELRDAYIDVDVVRQNKNRNVMLRYAHVFCITARVT